MIARWEDYYRILQVHFMAEPEIIKSAYLRLSKKYHPDVNPSESAEEKMKAINRAYEVLSDPVSRKHYLVRWMENYSMLHTTHQTAKIHPLDFSVEPGKKVMLTYLGCLSKGAYDEAFQLLSDYDKENIPKIDFIKWQTLVAEVFELIRFECELLGIYTDITLKGCSFETVVELKVKVHENNCLMGRYEEDEFPKCVVLEKDNWHVFLGYAELSTIIQRFNALAILKNKHRTVLDSVSGTMNRTEFQEKATYEQMRYNRYGNPFSVIFCRVELSGYSLEDQADILSEVGGIITEKIRNLDSCCLWGNNTYGILLPETDQSAARKTAFKIRRALEDRAEKFSMNFTVVQQRHVSLEDLFNRLQRTNDSFVTAQKNTDDGTGG